MHSCYVKVLIVMALWLILLMVQIWDWSTFPDRFNSIHDCPDCSKSGSAFLLPEDDPDWLFGDRIIQQLKAIGNKHHAVPILIYEFDESPKTNYMRRLDTCHLQNCYYTNIASEVDSAHALLFTPSFVDRMPLDRRIDQVWILQLMESPEHTQSLIDFNNRINFTSSYRWDSDLVTPYGKFVEEAPIHSLTENDIHKGKTKEVAWFVSNCFTNNDRRAYAKELSKFIQVDLFGQCGSGVLSKTERDRLLRSQYKFYLAFENSNCRDYITEKLFENALNNSVIPIVMGPSRSQYERIAPKHSFIHVEDFSTPQQLAAYLRYLSANGTAYNEYFAWQSYGRFVDAQFHCRLCALLQSGRSKIYGDIENWWQPPGECLLPKRVKKPVQR